MRDGGAEDAFYAARRAPGLAANAPLLRVAELAEVKGVTPSTLSAVAPFLSALPAGTPLNVNTAPPEVLSAVVDKLDGAGLAKLIAARTQSPFNNLAEFRAQLRRERILGRQLVPQRVERGAHPAPHRVRRSTSHPLAHALHRSDRARLFPRPGAARKL